MGKLKVAVLISGGGSNLQALLDYCAQEESAAEIVAVISNKATAYGLERAQKAGVETRVIKHTDYADREAFDGALHELISEYDVDLVCLAGFMRLLTDGFVQRWRDRLINIHPALLPSFKGLHTHARALETGVKFHGATVHYVRPAMDEGPIIIQACVPVLPDDSEESLAQRVLEQEHVIYPKALDLIARQKIRVSAERVVYTDVPVGAVAQVCP